MARYSKIHSNYVLSKTHQDTKKGRIYVRDWVTIGGQHQIEKGKKPYYSDTNFLFTDNSYPSYKKKHNYGKWVAHWDYEDVKNSKEDVNIVKVNTSSNDIRDFAYYGSAVELVKSSVTNIIKWFPARITLSTETVTYLDDNQYKELSGYKMLNNPFEVDFVHTLSEKEKEEYNVDRFLCESYGNFTFNGLNITSYTVTTSNDYLSGGCIPENWLPGNGRKPVYSVSINGVKLIEAWVINYEIIPLFKTDNLSNCDIKPKKELLDNYFNEIDGFEKQLLTLDSKPLYKNSFLTAIEGELDYKYVYRDYTWPSTAVEFTVGGETFTYGIIDISSQTYVDYVSSLIDMASVFDELWCDNLYRNMTHESIKNFDWTYTREYNEGDEQDNIDGGNQIMKLLRVYGRAFDDLKHKVDGIKYVSNNTYDGFINQPDAEISDRLELMGWDVTSTIPNFIDTDQGYVGKGTGYVIDKKTWNSLSSTEKGKYELAYYDVNTGDIIGKSTYDSLDIEGKKKFRNYYPQMDLSDEVITNAVISTFKDTETETKLPTWFYAVNSNNITAQKSDIDFMKRLLLSSSSIFNTKGTKHSIDMVMGMFGFGESDYTITETYYQTTPMDYTDEKYDEIENINYYKNYPKLYDDAYSGVPIKDIFLGSKHVIVPYYDQRRIYDGDFIFESRGGWAENNPNSKKYTETLSYLHVVSDFSDLLDIDPNSLHDKDIYYVANLSSYSEYVNTLPPNLSHFFVLVLNEDYNGKYMPHLPESWDNIDMGDVNNADTKRAKYLDSIISSNTGNNPHVGYGTYDSGVEFKEYLSKPFKYAIDEYLLDEDWKTKAEALTFGISDVMDNDKVKNLVNSGDNTPYYINRKYIKITNNLDNNLYKEYFMDVIVKYLMQVIPSTAILVLEGFAYAEAGSGEIDSYGDIQVTLSYTNDINADGSNTSQPILNYVQTVHMKNGSIRSISNPAGARISYTGDYVGNDGVVSGVSAYSGSVKQEISQPKVTVECNEYSGEATAVVYQLGKKVSEYGPLIVNLAYNNKIPANGSGTYSPTTFSYSQTVKYSDGSTSVVTTGGLVVFTSTNGYVNPTNGDVTNVAPNNTSGEITADTITVRVTLNGKSAFASADIKQLGRTASNYGEITVTLSYPNAIPQDGSGSSEPILNYSQVVTYTDGTTETITNGGTVSYRSTQNHVNTTTGVVSGVGPNTEGGDRVADKVTVTVKLNGKTKTATADVMQLSKSVTGYSNVTVNLLYPTKISYDGSGTSSPELSYSQIIYYSDGTTGSVTTGGTVSYSSTNHLVDAASGDVSGASANPDPNDRTVDTVTVTVALNGKTGTATANVKQIAGPKYGEITITSFEYPINIPAEGGNSIPSLNYQQTLTFPDGTTEVKTNDPSATKSFSSTNYLVDTNTGIVTKNEANDVTYVVTVDTVTVTVSNGGMSANRSVIVKQDAKERPKHTVRWVAKIIEHNVNWTDEIIDTCKVVWKDKEE